MSSSNNKPVEIVITGGPCAGKSTAMQYLIDHLSGLGWRALVVPEAATMLITGGIHDIGELAANHRKTYLQVQETLFTIQHELRKTYLNFAEKLHTSNPKTKTVIFYDRAELDNSAYMTIKEFEQCLQNATGKNSGETASQYDAVIHLVTAASGALEHYTTENNKARSETPEQAIEADHAAQQAWLGHSHYHVVKNDGNFDRKLSRTLATVLNILGEPQPVEIERKWIINTPPPPEVLTEATPVTILQTYLMTDGETERRVRSRTHNKHTTYFRTEKTPIPGKEGRKEEEKIIQPETYQYLSQMIDPDTVPIHKTRWCFVYQNQHFELDNITYPKNLWVLEAELVTEKDSVELPDFLDIGEEVTNDPAWKNKNIARK